MPANGHIKYLDRSAAAVTSLLSVDQTQRLFVFAGDLFRVQSLAEQSKALNAPTFAVQLPLLKAKVKVYETEVLEIVPVCVCVPM